MLDQTMHARSNHCLAKTVLLLATLYSFDPAIDRPTLHWLTFELPFPPAVVRRTFRPPSNNSSHRQVVCPRGARPRGGQHSSIGRWKCSPRPSADRDTPLCV